MTAPTLTAIVVSYNSADDLDELMPLLADPRIELVVIDNASTDDSAAIAERHGAKVLALPLNTGWARGCNIGAGLATASTLAFVNPDARPDPDALFALATSLTDPRVALVAPHFRHPDGATQAFYFRFPDPLRGVLCFLTAGQRLDALLGQPCLRHRTYAFGQELPAPVDQPGAACTVVRADDFRRHDGFRDDYFLFFADTDLCRRFRREGRSIVVRWDVDVRHEGGGSVRRQPDGWVRAQFQRDYAVYARHHFGLAGTAFTMLAVAIASGLVPFLTRVLRGRWSDAVAQLKLAVGALR